MRAKRENTYGMPARILTNAGRVRTMQDAHDHDAACRHRGTHPHATERVGHSACRAGRSCIVDFAARAAGTAAHPRPRWPRPLAERTVRVRPQVADHAQR